MPGGSVDLNPVIIEASGRPVAVDALVELGNPDAAASPARRPAPTREQWSALFDPKGVLVTGASTHPGGGVFGASGRSAARVALADRAPSLLSRALGAVRRG